MTDTSRDRGGKGDNSIVPYEPTPSIVIRGLALADEIGLRPAKIRILVVDDVVETRFNLAKLISFEPDMEVIAHAGDGREALRVAWDEQPDLVLMDIYMPGMDGITATEHLSATQWWTPVIMMSVQGDQDYLRRAMLAGAREYLVKPFSADELVNAIRHVFELEQLRSRTHPDPRPRRSTLGRAIPPPDRVSDVRPCHLLPTDAQMLAGFTLWESAGPMDEYQAPMNKYCNRVFTNGPRPSTVNAVIWTEVSVSNSVEFAMATFNRRVNHAAEEWAYGAPSEKVGRQQPEPWPRASEFSPVTELEINIGQQSRAFNAVMYGRRVVWVYVRGGRVVWGIRAYGVEPEAVMRLAGQIAKRSKTS